MSSAKFQVDRAALVGVVSACSSRISDLGQAGFGPKFATERVVEGVGEFATELGDSPEAFVLSWTAVFAELAESVTVIRNNIGNFSIDVAKTDADQVFSIHPMRKR